MSNEQAFVRQPRGPVFGWASVFSKPLPRGSVHLMRLPRQRVTTSGRAAIWQALAGLKLVEGARVLVPTYHCPTLVAPVVALKLRPVFYPVGADGLPHLEGLPGDLDSPFAAMIAPHYFGRGQSLSCVRAWCDQHEVVLIEDCAHTLFGYAGERPVGGWGDFATASLTKFLPVPEAGLLASTSRDLEDFIPQAAGVRQQLKALLQLIERRPGSGVVGRLMARLHGLRKIVPNQGAIEQSLPVDTAEEVQLKMLQTCDLARVGHRPTLLSRALTECLPKGGAVYVRRRNFETFHKVLGSVRGARPLWTSLSSQAAPYVYPLWVDEPDALYAELREKGLAVLRWDRVWPGTPKLEGDHGLLWSRHVLQLLCHQDLKVSDTLKLAFCIRSRLDEAAP